MRELLRDHRRFLATVTPQLKASRKAEDLAFAEFIEHWRAPLIATGTSMAIKYLRAAWTAGLRAGQRGLRTS